jgi:CheY-like chemotaxis protein
MARKRVLVVDDELPVRELLATLLGHLGHAWETACNAAEALSKLESNEFDLVLTDLNMPGMNGVELAREIKRRREGMLVVLITGGQPQSLAQDIDRVLLKPISVQELRETIASFTWVRV